MAGIINQAGILRRAAFAAGIILALQGCSGSDNDDPADIGTEPSPAPSYKADISWTEYGIPHVTAQDWGSLGYGYGYAYARDNYCVVMKEFVRAKGESARYLGGQGDLNADFVYRLYNDDERIERIFMEAMPQHVIDLATGYAAGLNRYLDETGVDNLAEGVEGCRGAEWVREVDVMDVARLLHKRVLRGSADPLVDYMVAAKPPAAGSPLRRAGTARPPALDPEQVREAFGLPKPEELGSNAYAVGSEASQNGAGVLLGNPHFPWYGPDRFYMSHLTIPGQYDVMGAALHGLPLVVIGFNRNLAWSHTVSTGQRFTLYELDLNPDNPLEYVYDGETRALEPVTVSAERANADGSIETVEHTFYFTHFGPVLDLGGVNPALAGWPNVFGSVVAYRDANLENLRGIEQWLEMGQATSLAEFKQALKAIGIPWVNTIAADHNGEAFYGDISAVPHVTRDQFQDCVRSTLQTLVTAAGVTTLDGSDSACEWGSDPGTAPGVFGYDSLPKLETREYAANSNDSYWLSNPRHLLEGYPQVVGLEDVPQTLRTRLAFAQAEERLAGSDGLGAPGFTVDNIRQIHYGARNLPAEMVLDDVLAICAGVPDWADYSASPGSVARACTILADWDRRHTVDSVGGHIFYELWREIGGRRDLWAVPFDPADPVHTPNTLNVTDDDVVEAVRNGLATAVARLEDNGISLEAAWGDVQFDERNGVRYPIHGASGSMAFSVIASPLVEGKGYAAIAGGNSYIQAITWDQTECPDAYAILTYSQSTDPASEHYTDATALYANGGWIDMPFCAGDIEQQQIGEQTIEE